MIRKRIKVLVSLLLLWSLIAWVAARALIVSKELKQADVLVVLSGSATYVERTRLAAELYSRGRAPRIVLTDDNERGGWSKEQQRNPFFVERAVEELIAAGVPADRIEVIGRIEGIAGTYVEAVMIREYALKNGLNSVLVVTSGYHSRRALWTFGRVFTGTGVSFGLEVVTPGKQTPAPASWWLHRDGWRLVGAEYPKLLYYKWRF